MTIAENLIYMRDEQIAQAIKAVNRGDELGAVMHLNAAQGFELKLNKLTVQQASTLI